MERRGARVLLVAWSLVLASCSDAVVFSGSYREVVPPRDALTGKYDQDFVLALDLFQFGDELGGIVRYHSLHEVEGRDEDPFSRREKVCFWTNAIEVEGEAQQIRLVYQDERDETNDLEIRPGQEEGEFLVQRVVFGAELGTSSEQQLHTVERLEDVDADNVCALLPLGFRLTLQLDAPSGMQRLAPAEKAGGLCSGDPCSGTGLTCDVLTGACLSARACPAACAEGQACSPRTGRCEDEVPPGKLTAALAWVGQGRSEVYAWGYRAADMPHGPQQTSLDLVRNLPPEQWRALPIPYVTSGGARVVMGIVLLYQDLDADPESVGEVSPDWDKREEALVGSSFQAVSDTARRGLVVLYIEGDPATLDPDFLSLFRDADQRPPVEGYAVYELTYDIEDPQQFEFRRATINAIKLYLRDWGQALSPDDIDKNLPRIPSL